MKKPFFSDKYPLPVLIFLTILVYAGLYCRFIFGNAVFMYNDIGSDSLSSSFPTLMMLARLYKEGSLGSYSLTYGLGGSTALYAIQYMNPLKFLLLPFGEAWFPVVILIYQFILHLMTALTAYGLISRLFKDRTCGVMAAIIWAYSGYMLGWGQNYSFGICIFCFTLAMWVLQLYLDKASRRRYFFLVLVFAFFVLTNYYFFYMAGIFIAFYILGETILRGRFVENENRPRHLNAFLILLRREAAVLSAALFALALAAAPLSQVVTSFLGSARTEDVTGVNLRDLLVHFDLRTILSVVARFLSPNLLGAGSHYGGTVDYYNIAFVFTSLLLVFAILYLVIHRKTALPALLFIGVSCGMLFFPAAGYLLTFNVTAQRYAFLIAFLAVLLIAAFLHSILREDTQARLAFAAIVGLIAIFSLLVGVFIFSKRLEMKTNAVYFFVTGIFALIFSLIFLLLGHRKRKKLLASVCLTAICLELLVSEWGTFYDRDFLTVQEYFQAHFNDPTRAAVERVKSDDSSLYRINTTDMFTYANEGMVDGFNATTAYASELPGALARLSATAGIQQYSVNFFLNSYDDYYLLTLLSGKYLVTDEPSPHSFAYDRAAYKKAYTGDHTAVFENENTLPFGYVYKTRLDNEAFESLSAFDRQRALTQGYILKKSSVITVASKMADYVPAEHTVDLKDRIAATNDVAIMTTKDGRLKVHATGPDPFLIFDIADQYSSGAEAFQYFSFTIDPATLSGRENFETFATSALNVDQLIETLFFVGEEANGAAMLLPDAVNTLRLDLSETADVVFDDITFTTIDDPKAEFAALKKTKVKDISFENNTYTATVKKAAQGSVLCVPLLYEQGWEAVVNGESVKPLNINGGLIGIPLAAGDCSVELTYTPPYLLPGIIGSALSFALLVFICFYRKKKQPGSASPVETETE